MKSLLSRVLTSAAVVATTACATTSTQIGSISELELQNEQLKQQSLVLESQLALQSRVENVAWPLLRTSVSLCGNNVRFRTGYSVQNAWAFNKEWRSAARFMGYGDSLRVASVIHGSPADSVGLRKGDRIVAIANAPIPAGPNAVKEFGKWIEQIPEREGAAVTVRVVRDSVATPIDLSIPVESVCAYNVVGLKDEVLNAWADGANLFITSGIARFAAADSDLAIVIGHELAHNVMHHMDAKKRNSGIGAILGAALDVVAATQGVNTQGSFSNAGANAGAQVFSQDFEREADYVGMYLMARSGYPYENAANFWRRMGQESPGSIKFASTHPTTAERFIRLDQAAKEIDQKKASKQDLIPNRKG